MLAQLAALEDGRIVRALSDQAPRAIRPRSVGAFTSDRRRTAALMPSEPMNRTRFADVPPHAANDKVATKRINPFFMLFTFLLSSDDDHGSLGRADLDRPGARHGHARAAQGVRGPLHHAPVHRHAATDVDLLGVLQVERRA